MGADAVLQAAEHRAQRQLRLEVAEALSASRRVLVARGDVLGAEVRAGDGDEVLAVQPGLGVDVRRVGLQPPGGLLGQPPAQGGVIAQRALGPHVRRLVTDPGLVPARALRVAGALLADAGQLRDTGEGVVALLLIFCA